MTRRCEITKRGAAGAALLLPTLLCATAADAQEQLLVNGDFDAGLDGWTHGQSGGTVGPGAVTPEDGTAQLREGDSYLVSLQQTFNVPPRLQAVTLEVYEVPGFDRTGAFHPDAFEVSLVDAGGAATVAPWKVGATSWLNLQEDGTRHLGAGAAFGAVVASVDAGGLATGAAVTLVIALVGGDKDKASGIRVDNVSLQCDGGPCTFNEPPVARCRDVQASAGAACAANVSVDDGSSDPDGDALTLTQSPAGPYIPGVYTVTLTVSDGEASDQCDATATVVDDVPPVVSLVGSASVPLECGATYTEAGATAADNCSGDLTGVIVTQGSVNTAQPGTYGVDYSAKDAAQNTGTAHRTIIVSDTQAPVLTLNGAALVTLRAALDAYVEAGASVSEVCDVNVQVVVGGDVVDDDVPGTYVVTYDATDASGNAAAQLTRTVTVVPACPSDCSGHGTCNAGSCTCDVGFTGAACDACLAGYWGAQCLPCPGGAAHPCSDNGTCDDGMSGTGACTCNPGVVDPFDCSPQDAVELLWMDAARRDDGVRVRWVTGAEVDCAQFELWRCEGGARECDVAAHRRVDGVDARPCTGGLAGALYEVVDRTAPAAVDVSYLLREHETTGGVRDYGPLRLPAGAREASWDPETGRSSSRGAWSPARPGGAEPGDGGGCAAAGGRDGGGTALAAVLLGASATSLRRRRRSRARA